MAECSSDTSHITRRPNLISCPSDQEEPYHRQDAKEAWTTSSFNGGKIIESTSPPEDDILLAVAIGASFLLQGCSSLVVVLVCTSRHTSPAGDQCGS